MKKQKSTTTKKQTTRLKIANSGNDGYYNQDSKASKQEG